MAHKTFISGPGLTLAKARENSNKVPSLENRKILKLAKKQWKERIQKEFVQLSFFSNFNELKEGI